jgi:hypothetical protein
MKKLIVLSLVTVMALNADAQRRRTRANTSQGNWAISLDGRYASNNLDPAGDVLIKSTQLGIAPSIGFFVADNLEVGLDLNIGNDKVESRTQINPLAKTNSTTNNTGFGLYVRKYWPVNNWFAFTGKANAGMDFGNVDNTSTNGTVVVNSGVSSQGYRGGLNLGMAFTPVNNIALQSTIGGFNLNNSVIDPTGASNSSNNTDIEFGLTKKVNFGITWFFGRGLWNNEN